MVLKQCFGHKTCTLVMQDQTGLDTMDLVIEVYLGEEGGWWYFFHARKLLLQSCKRAMQDQTKLGVKFTC